MRKIDTDDQSAIGGLEGCFRAIFEQNSRYTALLRPDGTVLEMSLSALDFSGRRKEQLTGTGFAGMWWVERPETQRALREAIERTASGKSSRLEIEAATSAATALLDLSLRPVRNKHGEIAWLIAEACDITERKASEELQGRVRRLDAVSQLSSGIAHDINNLLTVISGNLEMLGDELGTPRALRLGATARRALDRAEKLMQQLLAFSRKQRLAPSAVDANALVERMKEALRGALGEAITVELHLAPDLGRCIVDPNQLEIAILNLAVNGSDATTGAGRVVIASENASVGPAEARAHGTEAGDYVAISVTDFGAGMTQATLARAFDPFFTTKEVGKGPGLGLSTVYGFVKQSGGHIVIDSAVGRGTTVRLYLPRAASAAAVS